MDEITSQTSINLFNKYYKDGLVIDIGCGCSTVLPKVDVLFDKAMAHPLGYQTIATHFGDFHDMEFDDNYFGYVYANNVIEHSKYPEVALNEWVRILKVGGILQIEWPSWLEKRNPTDYIEKYKDAEKALEQFDLEKYTNLGMNINWVSVTQNGTPFLDTHYNICSLDEMIEKLPSNLKLLETGTPKDSIIIAEKI